MGSGWNYSSKSCQMADFSIKGFKPSGSATTASDVTENKVIE
jgi:hypothetical protein